MARNYLAVYVFSVIASVGVALAEDFNVFRKLGAMFGLVPDERDRTGTPTNEIYIIGAGLPRTGTASLRAAFEELGYRTHHMEEVFMNSRNRQAWLDYATGLVGFDAVIQDMLELGFNATIDMPSQAFYKELMLAFPNAKVLLSVRDKAEDWAKSFTVLRNFMIPQEYPPFAWIQPFKSVNLLIRQGEILRHTHPHFTSPHPQVLTKVYEEWIAQVKQTVPPERLLEFNVKQGWAPLCDFLGLPVPEKTFPRINDGATLQIVSCLLWFVVITWPIYPFILLIYVFRLISHLILSKAKRD